MTKTLRITNAKVSIFALLGMFSIVFCMFVVFYFTSDETIDSPSGTLSKPISISEISQINHDISAPLTSDENSIERNKSQLIHQEIENYALLDFSIENAEIAAENLIPLLNSNISLIDQLFDEQFPTLLHERHLLEIISYGVSEHGVARLRDYALEKINSSDSAEATHGLELLSLMKVGMNTEARHALMEFSRSTENPGSQMKAILTLGNSSESELERDSVVDYLSEMSRSNHGAVRAMAIQQIQHWNSNGQIANMLAENSLKDPDPMVRATAIRTLTRELDNVALYREDLFAILGDANEESTVKIVVAEALGQLPLSEAEIAVIDHALQGEDFVVVQSNHD